MQPRNVLIHSGAVIREAGEKAFYRPSTDEIYLPERTRFASEIEFYSVALHELTHWTGAKHRLARDFANRFGTEAYAFEELIAELGSAFLNAELGFCRIHDPEPCRVYRIMAEGAEKRQTRHIHRRQPSQQGAPLHHGFSGRQPKRTESRLTKEREPMPIISTFYGIIIQMYWDDHAPPHFHARYAEDANSDRHTHLGNIEGKNVTAGSGADTGMGAGTPRRTHGGLGIMPTQATTKKNIAASIVPPIQIGGTPWDVMAVEALDGYRLHVRFADGLEGEVDMSERVRSPRAGVFTALADPDVFAQAYVELGAVTWPGELDLAPDAMHDEIKENGVWKLS